MPQCDLDLRAAASPHFTLTGGGLQGALRVH